MLRLAMITGVFLCLRLPENKTSGFIPAKYFDSPRFHLAGFFCLQIMQHHRNHGIDHQSLHLEDQPL